MRTLGSLPSVVHVLSTLMMVSMVASPLFFGFIMSIILEAHVSCLGIAVAILLLDGLTLIVIAIVRSVLPGGSL